MADKRKSQRRHVQIRAEQRFGISLTAQEYEEMCRNVAKGLEEHDPKIVLLEKQSLRVSMFALWQEDKWIPIIWDKQRKSIASFLPKEALIPYEKKFSKVVI